MYPMQSDIGDIIYTELKEQAKNVNIRKINVIQA